MNRYICIIGNDAAGKSTTANKIVELYSEQGINTEIVAFATPLKSMLFSLGVPVYTKPYPPAVRNVIRAMGDVMRHLHGKRYWSKQLICSIENTVKNNPDMSQVYVVDDMRYWSEFNDWMDTYRENAYIIAIGYPNPNVKVTDPDSVIEVNDLLGFLRNHNHGLNSRLLLLEGEHSVDQRSIERFITNINNK